MIPFHYLFTHALISDSELNPLRTSSEHTHTHRWVSLLQLSQTVGVNDIMVVF